MGFQGYFVYCGPGTGLEDICPMSLALQLLVTAWSLSSLQAWNCCGPRLPSASTLAPSPSAHHSGALSAPGVSTAKIFAVALQPSGHQLSLVSFPLMVGKLARGPIQCYLHDISAGLAAADSPPEPFSPKTRRLGKTPWFRQPLSRVSLTSPQSPGSLLK